MRTISDSESSIARCAPSANLISAIRNCFSASIDSTRASGIHSPLLEILFHERRLLPEEQDVLLRCFQEVPQCPDGLLEGFRKLLLLLIAPGGLQPLHLGMQAGDKPLEIVVEAGEILCEAPQLRRIDIGFGHR